VNNFFTSLKGQPKDQIRAQVQAFTEANPQVKADLQGIRQPSADFRARCGSSTLNATCLFASIRIE
jgi:heme-binding protein